MPTSMSTANHLASNEVELLLSLSDLELETFLRQLPMENQRSVLRQLATATGLAVKPEPLKLPLIPTPRQNDFLQLSCEEALYGGAAGGGKSEALLMWLAEGVGIPGYSGIIFRRTFPQLNKSNDSLIAKSYRLYPALGGVYHITNKCWTFPLGETISFGHLQHENSVYDYQGSAFHRIAFDELTQFTLDQYLYLFSRIRSALNFPITLGVRASANPGGIGHIWVKDRFITIDALEDLRGMDVSQPTPPSRVYWPTIHRAFVPARIADNPFLDLFAYEQKLNHLPPVTRERLKNGDWSIMPDGLIKPNWLRYFTLTGEHINLQDAKSHNFIHCHQRECYRFATIDTAGSAKEKTQEAKGKPHSWSVIAVWDRLPPQYQGPWLVCRHIWRGRVGFTELCQEVRNVQKEWKCSSIKVEDATMGGPLQNLLRSEMPIQLISTGGKDKVTRAAPLLNMLEKGQVFLPKFENDWRPTLEAEWLGWQGLEGETADQIDVAAYAAAECSVFGSNQVVLPMDPRKRF